VEILHSDLSFAARLVYAELALWVFQGKTASVGLRKMAERLNMSRQTVISGIAELVTAELIEKGDVSKGQRGVYVLTSPVFGQKQGKVTEVGIGPSGGSRLVSIAEDVA
jgi:DNA-binding MarR family transcriptional regulator